MTTTTTTRRARLPWFTNDGAVAFTAVDSFTRTAVTVLKALRREPGDEAHMRVGNFGVVLFGTRDLIAAPIYSDGGAAMRIGRDSEYWDVHVRNRTRQLGLIERALRPTHPHHAAIAKACADERASLR